MARAAARLSGVGAMGFFTFAASGGTGQSLSCAAVHPAKSKATTAITNRLIPFPAKKPLRAIRSLRDLLRPGADEYIPKRGLQFTRHRVRRAKPVLSCLQHCDCQAEVNRLKPVLQMQIRFSGESE